MSRVNHLKRIKALHRKVFSPPKQIPWVPLGVCVIEEDDVFYYADEEAQAIGERCDKLGITPNIYIVSDEWCPDMDGTEVLSKGESVDDA